MTRQRTRDLTTRILAMVGLAALSASLEAGINSWTPSAPGENLDDAARFIAAHPLEPYVVYAVFENVLHRSPDGGATWSRLVAYENIYALLVHPADPHLLFLSVGNSSDPGFYSVVRSTDGGVTWTKALESQSVQTLAGSPTDAATVYAGGYSGYVLVSTDGGAHWASGLILGLVAALVVPPDTPETVYAGTEADYYYFSFVGFGASQDSGARWRTEPGSAVRALVVDPEDPTRLYMGRDDDPQTAPPDTVWKSEDAGLTWSRSSAGLPAHGTVRSLAIDPSHPQNLYAATSAGIYRTRDSGLTWTAFSAGLVGLNVASLAIGREGRVLYAATDHEAFQFELAAGPVDVSAAGAGSSRILGWNTDRLVLQTLDGTGHWETTPASGPSATWIATAISSDATRDFVLWQNGDGRSALEVVGPAGQESSTVFSSTLGMPTDVSAISAGGSRLLVRTRTDRGGTSLVRVDATGHVAAGPVYGDTTGWTALALAEMDGDHTAVLWRSADGRSAVSLHTDGAITTTWRFAAVAGWTVQDIAAAPDGSLRILARSTSATMQIWTIDATGFRSFSAVHETPGLGPQRISVGADGNSRVLWSNLDGRGSLWILDAQGNALSESDIPEGP